MRLIDADKFMNYMESKCDYEAKLDSIILAVCRGAITEQPTAYDIDKVVEELEKIKGKDGLPSDVVWNNAINMAIEIAKAGGKNDD